MLHSFRPPLLLSTLCDLMNCKEAGVVPKLTGYTFNRPSFRNVSGCDFFPIVILALHRFGC